MQRKQKLISGINVFGKHIKIIEKDLIKEEIDGRYLATDALIEIEVSLSDSKKVEILAHELCHAMLDLTGWSNFLPDAVEESLCILCERFVGVLKQPFFKE